jgi:hypothetical protein
MKHLFTAAAMLFSMTAFAQVGINNTSPKATLDITAKTTDGSKPEGLIIPQLSGSNIHTATAAGVYGANQKGLIIYATSADSSPISTTANITAAGYYYFDGTNWQKVMTGSVANSDMTTGVGGIYKGSGSLSGNTTVTQGSNTLAFTSTATNGFSVDGTTLSVDAANDRIGIGTAAPQARIHISGAGGAGGDYLRMTNSASDWALGSENAGAQNGISGQASLTIVDRANTVRRMTIGADNSFRLGGDIAGGNAALSINGATNNVGIGTNAPITKLDTRTNPGNASPGNGAIAIGETTQIATAAGAGAIRYNTTSKDIQYSDGASWNSLAKSDSYGGFVPVVKLVARKTTVQNAGAPVLSTITFPTVVSNPDGGYNASTGIYTVPAGESGIYLVSAAFQVGFNNVGNGYDLQASFNGLSINLVLKYNYAGSADNIGGSVAYYLTSGQTIKILSQTCAGCGATAYTYNSGVFSITKLSAN